MCVQPDKTKVWLCWANYLDTDFKHFVTPLPSSQIWKESCNSLKPIKKVQWARWKYWIYFIGCHRKLAEATVCFLCVCARKVLCLHVPCCTWSKKKCLFQVVNRKRHWQWGMCLLTFRPGDQDYCYLSYSGGWGRKMLKAKHVGAACAT